MDHSVKIKGVSLIESLVCSRNNTSASGNNRCDYSNKKDHRYAIQVARNLNLKVFKYNLKSDQWIELKK